MIINKHGNALISGPYNLLASRYSVSSKDTVIRTHTGRLIVSSNSGIDYSDDDGTSWTHVGSIPAVQGLEEACNVIFAYYSDMGGKPMRYSTDDGSTWQTKYLRNLYKAIGFNDKVLLACHSYDAGHNTIEMDYPGFKLYDVSSDTYQGIPFPETYIGDMADVVKINDSEVITYVNQNGNKVYRLNITTKTWTLVADLSSLSNVADETKVKLFKDCGVIITKDNNSSNNSSNKYLVSRIDYGPTSASNIIDITYINKYMTLDHCELCLANNSLFICHRDDVVKLGGFTTWSSDRSPIVPETILDKRYRPLYIAKYNLLMFLGHGYGSDYSTSVYGRDIKYSLDDGNTFNTIDLQLTDAQAKANVPLVYIDPDKLFWCSGTSVNVFNIAFEAVKACTKYLDQNGAQELVTQFKAYCDAKVGA